MTFAKTAQNQTTAYAASLIIKASGGALYKVIGYNSGAAQFIQVHNSATLPANGAAPLFVQAIAATSNFEITLPDTPLICAVGIVLCNSSTGATKTIGGADCWFNVFYR